MAICVKRHAVARSLDLITGLSRGVVVQVSSMRLEETAVAVRFVGASSPGTGVGVGIGTPRSEARRR
jgi:hypothetical protein